MRRQLYRRRKLCKQTHEKKNASYGLAEYAGCGLGVVATARIPPNTYIGEYIGEPITHEQLLQEPHMQSKYVLTVVPKKLYLDAASRGGWLRFMNHSCEPNCEAESWVVSFRVYSSNLSPFLVNSIGHLMYYLSLKPNQI